MCFNEQVSITTFIIGLIGSYLLYKKGLVVEAIFYAWVVQMQLIEYFLWKNQPCSGKTEDINKRISRLGIIINHLEPIILWIAVILLSKKKLPTFLHIFMTVFLITTVVYTIKVFKDAECTTVTPESEPHLFWKWNQSESPFGTYYFYFLLALVLLSLYGLKDGHINAIIILTGFAISYLIYGNKHSTGSMWCFAAAFAPFVLLFLTRK